MNWLRPCFIYLIAYTTENGIVFHNKSLCVKASCLYYACFQTVKTCSSVQNSINSLDILQQPCRYAYITRVRATKLVKENLLTAYIREGKLVKRNLSRKICSSVRGLNVDNFILKRKYQYIAQLTIMDCDTLIVRGINDLSPLNILSMLFL